MAQWTPVQKNLHQNTRWQAVNNYSFTQQDTAAPLLLAEVSHALPFYTLAFIKNGDTFQLVALQSLQPGVNAYCNHQGKWRVNYIPAIYRGYPFRLLQNSENNTQVLCFNAESGRVGEDTQHRVPLFEEDGTLAEKTQGVFRFLQQCEQSRQITQAAVDALAEHQLLTPWEIPLKGAYRIDEAALNALQADPLQQLHQKKALAVAYAQINSQTRLQSLQTLSKGHIAEQQRLQETPKNIDLDQFFGEAEEDIFKF